MNTQIKTIGELAQVISGINPRPGERKKAGKYLLLGGRNIRNGSLVKTNVDSYVDEISSESYRRAIVRPGDIIVSTLFDRRKLLLFAVNDPPSIVISSCAIIRSGDSGDYIVSYLRTVQGQKDFLEKASKFTSGTFIPRLYISELAAIEIPIIPVSELGRLGDGMIEKTKNPELIALKKELESKDAEISQLKIVNAELARFYEDRIQTIETQIATNDLLTRIKHGETAQFEFKSSLRWNIKKNGTDHDIENAVLKTIAAFCNTKGGELIIGIDDNGAIIGIEQDRFPNTDRFLLHLRNLITDRLKPCLVEFVDYEIVNYENMNVCHFKCKPSNKEVWLKPSQNDPAEFYVRNGPASTSLDGPDAVEYIREHFDKKVSPI